MTNHETMPENNDAEIEELKMKRKRAVRITAGLLTVVAIGGGGAKAVSYGVAALGEYTPSVTTDLSIENPGKASVIKVDMTVSPVTVSTAETKVEGFIVRGKRTVNTGWLFNRDITLSDKTVNRKATIKSEYRFDPKKVKLSYDPNNEKMTFEVIDKAISSEVGVVLGTAETTNKTQALIDYIMPDDEIESLRETYDGTFHTDTSRAPIFRSIVDRKIGLYEGLEKFADLSMALQVDEQCTPLITRIPGFTDFIKTNIRENTKKVLLDLDKNGEPNDILKELIDNPDTRYRIPEIAAKAEVILPENYQDSIVPDKENIAAFKDYDKIKLMTVKGSEKAIECGISKDMKLTVVDGSVSNG